MFSPDPGSWFLPIPDLGSKNSYKRKGCGSGSVMDPDPEPYWIRIGIQPEMRIRASLTCDMLRPIVSWKTLIMMSNTDVLVLFANSQESQIFLWPTVQSACIRTPAPIWTGFMLSSQIRASQAVFRHVLWKIQQVKQCICQAIGPNTYGSGSAKLLVWTWRTWRPNILKSTVDDL